ncbi:hypothetical protein D8674_026395 [Pyrus ussuriensis x Pyrus communis]|uniref:Uncharacterized protein n=1 Tax=Pyrus ussuriensis x Pyrus communis TaxID=2448454 RepID=A0A5N5IB94_9ROSA|nr:hypothetical protein D8674_026395 [Pyrus ussuriensis x Pyrus communis]
MWASLLGVLRGVTVVTPSWTKNGDCSGLGSAEPRNWLDRMSVGAESWARQVVDNISKVLRLLRILGLLMIVVGLGSKSWSLMIVVVLGPAIFPTTRGTTPAYTATSTTRVRIATTTTIP